MLAAHVTHKADFALIRPWLDSADARAPAREDLRILAAIGVDSGKLAPNHPLLDALDDREGGHFCVSLDEIRDALRVPIICCLEALDSS